MRALRLMRAASLVSASAILSVAVVAALSLCSRAYGQTAIVSKPLGSTAALTWVAPTQFVDGSTIPASDAVVFDVYQSNTSPCTSFAPSIGTRIASNLSVAAFTTPAFSVAGSYCFETTALVAGVESAASNAVAVTVAAPIPKSPANLTVK